MSCDRFTALRRLIALYLEKVEHNETLERHAWDEHRAKELVRQWLRERPAPTTKRGGQQ